MFVAVVCPFKTRAVMFSPKTHPRILLLDAIQDVRNLGAILRSASCAGIDGVVLCKSKSAPLCAPVFKASAGLAEHLDIFQSPSIKYAVLAAKDAGYTMYMAVLDGKDVTKVVPDQPWCLVIGNEAVGITKEIRQFGQAVTIPQRSPEISYNASVAAGILLFYMCNFSK